MLIYITGRSDRRRLQGNAWFFTVQITTNKEQISFARSGTFDA